MALVITIIILLILAGVTIGMITGNNGVLDNANNAKILTQKSEQIEILEKAKIVAAGENKKGKVEKEYLDKELDNYYIY